MGEGGQGAAELQHRAQAGLLHRGKLPSRHLQGRPEFPQPQFRAALQRKAVFAAHLLLVPYKDDQGTQPHDEQLQRPYAEFHHPEGDDGQGDCSPFHGVLRTVRAHRERQRSAPYDTADGRGDYRDGQLGGNHREVFLALAGGHRLLAGPVTRRRGDEDR